MNNIESKKKTDRLGIIACFIFAITCLSATIYQTRLLLPLLNHGSRAEALVVGIDVGAKGSKKAIFQFVTEKGRRGALVFKMFKWSFL